MDFNVANIGLVLVKNILVCGFLYFLIRKYAMPVVKHCCKDNDETITRTKNIFNAFIGFLFVMMTWNGFNAYGPRLTIESEYINPQPQVKEIESNKDIFEQKDRSKLFSDELKGE